MAPALRIYCLGEFDVRSQDEPDTSLQKPATLKSQSLLIYLIWHRDRAHARERIAGTFWGDYPDPKARRSLSTSLWHIRRCLPDGEYLLTGSGTLQFNPDVQLWIDAERFASLAAETEMTSLQSAVEMYVGPFMDGFYDDWIINERYRLQALFIETLARLMVVYERAGDLEGALATAQRLIEYEPLSEEAHRAAMRAYHGLGQRNAALVQYETCRAILAEELDVDPAEETSALYERIRTAQPGQLINLPSPSTPFVGRLSELADINGLLSRPDCRLLTVVGPGGIGKSRLAIEAAQVKGLDFPDGIYFVSLMDVSEDELLIPAIADALDFPFYGRSPPKHQLLDYLRQKELLLILDNFEHLIGATDLLTDILQGAPRLKLLVTSRVRLNLQEEWLFEVGGMAFPLQTTAGSETTGKAETPHERDAYSAVQLFVQNARRVRRRFTLSEENRPFVAHICQLVEGMPLGIELAAVWVRVLSCREIAREIERNLAFLTTTATDVPQRHRSMEAVCRHSWDLLSETEKQAFKKLAVFRSGFRRPAAEAVADASLHVLASLADKSLLRLGAGGRYQMHELLRQFAAAKLEETPDTATQTYERHCRYFMAFLRERESDLEGRRQREAFTEIRAEIKNVRLAWRWALAHNRLDALADSFKCLSSFYDWQGWFEEGEEAFGRTVTVLEQAERLAEEEEKELTRRSLLGMALARQGLFCFRLSQNEKARELLRRSIAVCRNQQLDDEVAFVQNVLGSVAYRSGQYQEAQRYFEESLAKNSDLGNQYGVARCLNGKGLVAIGLEEYGEAARLFERSRHLFGQIGVQRGAAVVLNNLGLVALNRERYAEAKRYYEEGLALSQEIGARDSVAICLDNIGFVAYLRGQLATAVQHCQQSLRFHREIGNRWGEALTLLHLGLAYGEMGDYAVARQYYRDSRALSAEIGARWIEAYTLANLGSLALEMGDEAEARRLCQESVAAFKDIGHTQGTVVSIATWGQTLEQVGERDRAQQLYQEGLHLSQNHNYKFGIALSQRNLGDLARARGELEEARRLLQSSYTISREIGSGASVALALCSLADTADAQGESQEAIQLFRQGLEKAMDMGAVPIALLALVGTAVLWGRQSAERKEQAVNIATFVLHHAAANKQTQAKAKQLLAGMVPTLSSQAVTAAQAKEKNDQLQKMAARILAGD